jgi:hypothetical protein
LVIRRWSLAQTETGAVDDPFCSLITYNLPEEALESSSGGLYAVIVVSGSTGLAGSNEAYR